MKTCRILIVLAGLALGLGSAVHAAPIPTAPIFTNKLKFRIPFHYDSNELTRLGAREIRLYVSRDRGRAWQQVQAVGPDAGKFNFQAPTDGEYWFIVRTLDSKNLLHPDTTVNDPGLQVIVDTTLPKLELELRQPAPGKVQLLWTATDEHLDPSQLRLEYMQPGLADWQPVSVLPKASGQTAWPIPQGGMVAVRGSIADFARNTAQDQVQLLIAPGNQAVPRPGSPDSRQPVAGPQNGPRDNLALTLPEHFPSSIPGSAHPASAASGHSDDVQFAPAPLEAGAGTTAPRNSFVSMRPEDRTGAGAQPDAAAGTAGLPRQPGDEARKRVVNTKQFQIGYKLQDVGPSGVSSVELFITQDNGATWYRYGADDDNQSPIQVEVPREGTYGFALSVRSGAGLASEPPQNGDRPTIVVVVDQTPPRLELFPVEQGRGKNMNKLLFSWRCIDETLSEKPISIYYSANGQSPWQPISGPVENTGTFIWNVSQGVPSKFFVRIEARDMAGNVQVVDSPQPVVIDLSRPTAKIIDVESQGANIVPR